jgi:hypothetical protein
VNIKTVAFRWDLCIRGLRSTIEATVQKVKFWSTLKPFSIFFGVTPSLIKGLPGDLPPTFPTAAVEPSAVPSPRYSKAFCVELLHGEGPPATATAAKAIPGDVAPPEAAHAIAKSRLIHLAIASSPPTVSATASEQNGFVSPSRSCRWKRFSIWCPIAWAWAALATVHVVFLPPLFLAGRTKVMMLYSSVSR